MAPRPARTSTCRCRPPPGAAGCCQDSSKCRSGPKNVAACFTNCVPVFPVARTQAAYRLTPLSMVSGFIPSLIRAFQALKAADLELPPARLGYSCQACSNSGEYSCRAERAGACRRVSGCANSVFSLRCNLCSNLCICINIRRIPCSVMTLGGVPF
ncbi:hypothetical protein HmCmsJML174_01104 [Escherichia coli]|nr:hypothetical protein HmCmsJML174_01104 [Escherichia coli]